MSPPPPKRSSSLFSRFALSTALLAAVLVVATITLFVATHLDFFEDLVDNTLQGYSSSLAEHLWRRDEVDPRRMAMRHAMGIAVADEDGLVYYGPDGEISDRIPPDFGRRFRRIDVPGPGQHQISFFWDRWLFLRAHIPLLVGLLTLLLAAIGATYAFQLALLRPLIWLRSGVEAVTEGHFDTRVPVVRNDEIGRVARAFNRMTARVEAMIRDRETLLGDVSHELRSPLARIKVALELLPESSARDAIERDVGQMEGLTTVLLERERLRRPALGADEPSVDVAGLTREVVESFRSREPGVLVVEAPDESRFGIDPTAFRVLLRNLLDNATKFSLPDSRPIEVVLRRGASALELSVLDDGPGIPTHERERVLEPFVKLDPARGHGSGFGLGLDLCRRIVENAGGTLQILGREPRGTEVRIRLASDPSVAE